MSKGVFMATRAYVDTSIGQIHYRSAEPVTRSEKPPLLLLHMSPASSLVYENFIDVIGTTRLCIAPDTPGYGNSDAHVVPPSIEDYASVMLEVIENLELDQPVDVMGYHTGSMTSVAMAVRSSSTIRRLVLVSAPIFTEDEVRRFRSIYSTESIWTVEGDRLLDLWKWFVDFFRVGTVHTVQDAGRIFYERLSGRERYWWGHSAAFAYDFADALAHVRQPILVLNPDDDLVSVTPRAADLMINGRIVDLPDMTHGFLDNHSDRITDVVERFLDE